ncbi:hypothetical protein TNCV_818691 [Trichonephila clavipes]|nr:hypothetical protein TNCV_818691 [Trichonephila clavipes]
MKCLRKLFVLLDCPIVLSKDFIAVEDDNVCTDQIMANKDILESLFKVKKNIIDIDSGDKNEMNNSAPVPPSTEMRNIMKSMRSYLDAHSNQANGHFKLGYQRLMRSLYALCMSKLS